MKFRVQPLGCWFNTLQAKARWTLNLRRSGFLEFRVGGLVGSPQTRNFQPVFDELTTNMEMFGNLKRGLTFKHKSPQSRKRHQSRCSDGICSLFVGFPVVSRDG